jgi:signal transduction histidine kinase
MLDESRGLGLRLVRQRLEAIYGGNARFDVRTAPGDGFRVAIDLPAELR